MPTPAQPSDDRAERLGGVAIIGLVILACVAWYFVYVQPRDAFLHAVLECVGDDPSHAAFTACEAQVRQARAIQ